jgi:phosphoinositide-3-kinase regulatory subunit 4
MGNAAPHVKPVGVAAASQRDPLTYLQIDLPKLIKKNELGTGKFMKSFLCKVEEGVPVVVKVYVRSEGEPQEELDRAREGIEEIQTKLKIFEHPNVLPYQRAVLGQQRTGGRLTSAGYVIRQHFYTCL